MIRKADGNKSNNFILLQQRKRDLRSLGNLRSPKRWVRTDVSGQRFGPIFKRESEEESLAIQSTKTKHINSTPFFHYMFRRTYFDHHQVEK